MSGPIIGSRAVGRAFVIALALAGTSHAAVSNLAADWSTTQNPNGVWSYGYLDSEQSLHTANTIQEFQDLPGAFVAYDEYYAVGDPLPLGGTAGPGLGWSTGDEPGALFGHLSKLATQAEAIPYGDGVDLPGDWPSMEGENPNYPTGAVGGHSANEFNSGPSAIRYTAPTAGPVDVDVRFWQAGLYAQPGRSQTRAQAILILKETAPGQYLRLVQAPSTTKFGYTNYTGTPQHNLEFADPVNDVAGWESFEEMISYTLADSYDPNVYRVRDLQLNAGESVIFSMIGYDDGAVGFMAFDMDVKTGADRVQETRWSMVDDFDFTNGTVGGTDGVATGLGPNGAWSYGVMIDDEFTPFDKRMTGIPSETGATPGRDRNGYVQNCPAWLLSTAPEPSVGRITPAIMKDYDGHNFTKPLMGGIPTAINGDWGAGQVAMALPTAEVDSEQTNSIRWTAPRAMSVDIDGELWRATLPNPAADTRVKYSVLKNGVEIANGTVDELSFDSAGGGTNSFTPETFDLNNIAVAMGDVIELQVSPLNQAGANSLADFDRNNSIQAADLNVWKNSFGVDGGADADLDGDSDGTDFLEWQRKLGTTVNLFVGVEFDIQESAAAVASVPEPASLALVLMGCLGLRRRTRCAAA